MYISTWPSLSPSLVFSGAERDVLPFPLNAKCQTSFFAARYGIFHLFKALRQAEVGEVLVPAYHHGNEVKAIRAAGVPIRFYSIKKDLLPDLDELHRLCAAGAKVLYVIHYLGWPQPLDELKAICNRWNVTLIEDCALSMLSETDGVPLGSVGDYSFFCLYKTLPVPNGGLLVQNRNVLSELCHLPLRQCGVSSVMSRSCELVLERVRSRSNAVGKVFFTAKRLAGRLTRQAGAQRLPIGNSGFDEAHAELGISSISSSLLKHFDYPRIVSRRRENYVLLNDALTKTRTQVMRSLPDGVCPLFFPVLVRDKHSAAEALWSRGIGAVEFWNEGDEAANAEAFPEAHFLRRHLLELPIHQDLSSKQIEYIARETNRLDLL